MTPSGRPVSRETIEGTEGERAQDGSVGERDLRLSSGPLAGAAAEGARTLARRSSPYAALAIALVVAVVVLALAAAAVIAIYAAVTTERGVAGLDQPLLDDLVDARSPVLTAVLEVVTHTAGKIGMPVIAVLAMVVLGVRRRSWTPVVLIGVTGAVSVALTVIGKEVVGRVRPPFSDAVPPLEQSASFPSGHTLNAVAVIGMIAYLVVLRRESRRARVAVIGGAVLYMVVVGFSRVYLGHHWFTDVLAGFVLGTAWLALVITAHRFYLTTRSIADDGG